MDNLIKNEAKKNKVHGPIGNYLSDTDVEEYVNYPRLLDLTRENREARILKLWRSCFNCSIGVAIMLKQKEAVITKIQLFGRQLVAD